MTAVLLPHRAGTHDPVIIDAVLGERDRLADQLGGMAPDSELVCRAHDEWGLAAPGRLTGAFGYALRLPGSDTIVLARDVTGQVPLVYAVIPDGVVVGTDVAAVAAHPGVPQDLDLEALAHWYALADRPIRRRTGYRAIAKVAPAHVVTITHGRTSEQRYWFPERLTTAADGRLDEFVDRIDRTLQTVVAEAVAGHDRVGVHISGGLDSGLLAAITRQVTAATMRGYSYAPSFDTVNRQPADERDRVLAIAAQLGVPVTFTDLSDEDRRRFAGRDPVAHPARSWLLESAVVRDAASHGITVMVSGWGGDEVLGARAVPSRGATGWRRWAAETRRGPIDRVAQEWRPGWPEVAAAVTAQQRRYGRARTVRARQVVALTNGHLAARNESWHVGALSLGARHVFPLQDRRVLELALQAPPEAFRSEDWPRQLLRRIAARHLPPDLVWHRDVKRQPAQDVLMADLREAGYPRGEPGPVSALLDLRDHAARASGAAPGLKVSVLGQRVGVSVRGVPAAAQRDQDRPGPRAQ